MGCRRAADWLPRGRRVLCSRRWLRVAASQWRRSGPLQQAARWTAVLRCARRAPDGRLGPSGASLGVSSPGGVDGRACLPACLSLQRACLSLQRACPSSEPAPACLHLPVCTTPAAARMATVARPGRLLSAASGNLAARIF